MRIFTCTPVAFGGGADFFARDSGLLCRGLQSRGVDSQAVMPGERKMEDEADLIRTDYTNLESADWWKSLELDGVVLYSWGRPKFRKVASAVREAGIFLVLNQDSGGLISPLAGWRDWLSEQWILTGQGRGGLAWLKFLKLTLRGMSVGIAVSDPLRATHLRQGDVIACVSPKAADHYRKICRTYGGDELASRVAVIPHAVESQFRYSGEEKHRQIVCVGRWDDEIQKRPWLLMNVMSTLLRTDDAVLIVIVGTVTQALKDWHRSLASTHRERVRLQGRLDRNELAKTLAISQVFYSPSSYESFGIAAAEALCCGCSVVAQQSVSMASFEWFVSEQSGQLAEDNSSQQHAEILMDELNAWDRGDRNSKMISNTWGDRLHADKVAAMVVHLKVARSGSDRRKMEGE